MNKSSKTRLVLLRARLQNVTEFVARKEDDDGHLIRNTALVAGGATAAYGGSALLRGRAWQKKLPNTTGPGLGNAFRAGLDLNRNSIKGAAGRLRALFAARR